MPRFLTILISTFLGKSRMQPLIHLTSVFWLHYRNSKSSNFRVFHIYGCISLRPAAFLLLIFVCTTLSYWVNCSILMSNWFLIIFVIKLSVTYGESLSRHFKWSFHICINSSWLAAFNLALKMIFPLNTLFTVCHATQDSLFSTKIQILLVWHWMYSIRSFWYTLISSNYFLKFLSVGIR